MYCQQCGSKVNKDSYFCHNCGVEIKNKKYITIAENTRDIKKIDNKKQSNLSSTQLMGIIGSILILIIGKSMGKYLGFAPFIFILIIIFIISIGSWFPKWYVKRGRVNQSFIRVIAWSNLITWFLPVLGLLTGVLTIKFYILGKGEKKYKILGIVSIILSIINAVIGIIIKL